MENVWVTRAEYIKDYEIGLSFNDGACGIVDLEPYPDKPIFKLLNDMEFFRRFKLGSWTIGWENGADFAPEFLYEKCNEGLAQV